jgi:superfamily II DNA or RNA helicase
MKTLRTYQEEAIQASFSAPRGIVCLPTGSGKTSIQSFTLIQDIQENPGHRVFLILAPRIVLSFQLMKEYYKDLNEIGIACWYAGLHSGGSVDINEFEEERSQDIAFQNIEVTTSSLVLRDEIEKAKNQDLPIIIFGTYHSAERAPMAMNGKPFNLVICDEAHYLVSDQFEDLVKFDGLVADRMIFYTATMQTTASDSGKGMNNKDRFGEVIYQKIPREMIDMGYMVRPRMHIIQIENDLDKDELVNNAGRVVAESFAQHEYIARRTGKVLVTCTGTPMVKNIIDSKEIRSIQRRRGCKVYAVGSDPSIGNQIDGIQYSRQEFLRKLREDGLDNSQEMIILHIDILTEGIDVPGITGILPFRSLAKSKFIQTLGRAARVCPDDLESFKDGEYTHNDLHEMVKPYAWVMLPDIEGEDSAEESVRLIHELRTYGFDPREDVFISNQRGQMPPVVLMDPLTETNHRSSAVKAAIDELRHEIESEEVANLIDGESFEEMLSHF